MHGSAGTLSPGARRVLSRSLVAKALTDVVLIAQMLQVRSRSRGLRTRKSRPATPKVWNRVAGHIVDDRRALPQLSGSQTQRGRRWLSARRRAAASGEDAQPSSAVQPPRYSPRSAAPYSPPSQTLAPVTASVQDRSTSFDPDEILVLVCSPSLARLARVLLGVGLASRGRIARPNVLPVASVGLSLLVFLLGGAFA